MLTPAQQDKLDRPAQGRQLHPRDMPHTRIAVEGPGLPYRPLQERQVPRPGQGRPGLGHVRPRTPGPRGGPARLRGSPQPEASSPTWAWTKAARATSSGPLVIAAAYVDERLARRVPGDERARQQDHHQRPQGRRTWPRTSARLLGDRFALVAIGPRAYNRLYASMRNVNRILAWGHARAIENLLEKVPGLPARRRPTSSARSARSNRRS